MFGLEENLLKILLLLFVVFIPAILAVEQRSVCYLDGHLVDYGEGGFDFDKACLDLSKDDPDSESWTVIEHLKGEEWVLVGGCTFNDETKDGWGCILPAGGEESTVTTSAAAIRRALSRRPRTRRCEHPRKWVRVRGKLRCRDNSLFRG